MNVEQYNKVQNELVKTRRQTVLNAFKRGITTAEAIDYVNVLNRILNIDFNDHTLHEIANWQNDNSDAIALFGFVILTATPWQQQEAVKVQQLSVEAREEYFLKRRSTEIYEDVYGTLID